MNTVRATIFNIFDDNKFCLLENSYERVTTAAILKNPLCHTIEVKLHFGPRVRSYWKCRLVGGLGDVAELEREQELGVRPDGVEGQRRKTNQLHFHGQTQQKLNRDHRTNERVRCRKIMVFEPNNRASAPRMNRKKGLFRSDRCRHLLSVISRTLFATTTTTTTTTTRHSDADASDVDAFEGCGDAGMAIKLFFPSYFFYNSKFASFNNFIMLDELVHVPIIMSV